MHGSVMWHTVLFTLGVTVPMCIHVTMQQLVFTPTPTILDSAGRFGPVATPFRLVGCGNHDNGVYPLTIEELMLSSCGTGLSSPCAPPSHIHIHQDEVGKIGPSTSSLLTLCNLDYS